MTKSLSPADLDAWTEDRNGPVALFMRQPLMPVEGEGGVIFPPTYAGIGYNISTLGDGTKVAEIDSVGSQANRIEPEFKHDPRLAKLVPQIDIAYGNDQTVSVFEAGHRLGDAVMRCTELAGTIHDAFNTYLDRGDASDLAKIGPTSLVFGVWDSRDTQAKLPRIVQCVIRAHDVSELKRSAQFNPALDYATLDVFSEAEREKQEGKAGSQLAERGYIHVPAVGTHGGVIAKGPIQRNVTLNLVQIRRLQQGEALRRYILGLSLVAATVPLDGFLRAGCLLTPDPDMTTEFSVVGRDGTRQIATLSHDDAVAYAEKAAKDFGVGGNHAVAFDKKLAKADATKKKS